MCLYNFLKIYLPICVWDTTTDYVSGQHFYAVVDNGQEKTYTTYQDLLFNNVIVVCFSRRVYANNHRFYPALDNRET